MAISVLLLITTVIMLERPFQISAMYCENNLDEGCHCSSKTFSQWTSDKQHAEITCCCKGYEIETIPTNLSSNVKHFEIVEAKFLQHIDADAFKTLDNLRKLSIKKCSNLRHVSGVLQMNTSGFLILSFSHNSLHDLPQIVTRKGSLSLPMIDFSFNEIRMLKTRSLHNVEAHSIDLSHNKIDVIEDYALQNAKLGILKLDYNPLTMLSKFSFSNASTLRNLSMSHSQMEFLPEEGLERVKKIIISENPNLKQLPSIFVFTSLEEAYLTYPYHCCLFKHAEVPKSLDIGKYTGNVEELSKKYCQPSTVNADDEDQTRSTTFLPYRKKRANDFTQTTNNLNWDDFEEESKKKFNTWGDFDEEDKSDDSGWGVDEEIYENDTLAYPELNNDQAIENLKHHGHWIPKEVKIQSGQIATFCNSSGFVDVKVYYSKIACYPEPDPLNPCEDVIGYVWLRAAIWFVWIMAILGNTLVMVILCATRQSRLRVYHFLMMNLAFADFCTGIYMAMLAVQDVRTAGAYYNFAVDWQTGWGCNTAGFLAVFASELSIFTMVVISFELWYNTKYVFYGGRLKLSVAIPIMAFGWLFSLTVSFLPLLGVFSSFSATSTCLPLRITALGDKIYLMTVLLINVICFAYIVCNYISVYCMVAGTNTPTAQTQDMAIAKRMAVLIGTDFICWAPTIFFGLTAAANAPLISVSIAKIFLVLFYPINAFTNPFLYVLLTKMTRKDMSRVARKHPWLKKVSVWSRSSSRNSSLWSSYSSRNNSRAHVKNTSMTATLTSWISNSSLTNSRSMDRKVSLTSTRSARNDSGSEIPNQSESECTIPQDPLLSAPVSKTKRPSRLRFSEHVQSFDSYGFKDKNGNIPVTNEIVHEEIADTEMNSAKPLDVNYWYKKKLSFPRFFSDKLDKSLVGDSPMRKEGRQLNEEAKLLASNSLSSG